MGRFEVRLGSGPSVTLSSKRAQALLAYLALPLGRAHPRDKLTGLFWPHADEDRARQSLRQTVLELRKRLAGARGLVAADDALSLDSQAVEVDVARFERLALATTPEALATTAALYDGELLEGFHRVSPPFEEWLVGERERLRQAALSGLSKLLTHQLDGPAEPAIRTAMRLLALDPLQESVHRALMRLYARQGRRTAALRQYRICAGTLQRELDVAPDEETERLYRELLREQVNRPLPDAAPGARRRQFRPTLLGHSTFPPTSETPLLGREEDLARLRRALADACRRRGRTVLVCGEAGIGKTTLVLRLAVDAARRSSRVLLGRCHESEQILPFSPWVDALRPVIAAEEPQLLGNLPPSCCAELARLFPTLDVASASMSTVSRDYRPLFESLAAVLDYLAAAAPVVLILEDLQWADDLSFRLLSFLARRTADRPVLLVATAREEDLTSVPGLRRLVEEMSHEPESLDRLNLAPLSRPHTMQLVHALVRKAAPGVEPIGERVWRMSEGNPFVIVEIVRAVEVGDLASFGGTGPVPPRVRDMVAARLDRLSEAAQRVLAVVAVSGRESRLDILRHGTGLGEAATVEALGELVSHRVLDASEDVFAFAHERVREVAYGRLLGAQRRTLHRAVAEAIEALETGQHDEFCDRLAHHYAQAGHAPKAIEHLILFAEKAMRRYALEDAARALREAMGLAGRLPRDEQDRRLIDLTLRLAFALSVLGRFREILELLLPQGARLQTIGAPPTLSGPYHCRLALTYSYLGEQPAATRHAERALEAARRCGDALTAGKAHYTLALSSYALGDLRAGVEHGAAAVASLAESSERYWVGLAYWVLGMNQAVVGGFEAALEAEALAEQAGISIGDARVRSLAVSTRGWVHALRGDVEDAVAVCTEGLAIARDPISVAAALRRLGMAQLAAGNPGAAASTLEDWLRRLGELGARLGLPGGLAALSEAHLLSGNAARARALAEESLRAASTDAHGKGCARRALGLVARAEGPPDDAEAELTEACRVFEAIGARRDVAMTHLALAEVARARGRDQAALEHLAQGRRLFRALNVPRYVEMVDRLARDAGLALEDASGGGVVESPSSPPQA